MFKTKISIYFTWPRLLALFALVLLIIVSFVRQSGAQTFSQGYGSDTPLQRGMIIQLKKSDTTKVEPVSVNTMSQMLGVIVDSTDASVTLGTPGQQNFVATTGQYEVLVSNQNGALNAGDYITISAIDGIGTKAGTKEQVVIGRALAGFDGKTNIQSTATIKDSAGKTITVAISRIKVSIGVARNPLLKATTPDLPIFLQKATTAIAGKPISAARAYVSIAIFIVSTIIAGSLMYSGIRSGIISIGRNPLSRKSIIRSMFQVILTGMIIFISGIFGVYLLLKL